MLPEPTMDEHPLQMLDPSELEMQVFILDEPEEIGSGISRGVPLGELRQRLGPNGTFEGPNGAERQIDLLQFAGLPDETRVVVRFLQRV